MQNIPNGMLLKWIIAFFLGGSFTTFLKLPTSGCYNLSQLQTAILLLYAFRIKPILGKLFEFIILPNIQLK